MMLKKDKTSFPALLLVFLAVLSAGCRKPSFRNDLVFENGNNKYKFTITVAEDMLYIGGKYNGADLSGTSGQMMTGKEIFQAAVADLNSDGEPEVYVFYRPADVGPGVHALTCKGGDCSSLGIEGSGGGPIPEDYCGGDSYRLEKDSIVRQYLRCPDKASGYKNALEPRTIRYKLKYSSQGYILSRADGPAANPTRP
ncbi:MAG: hypothetical protein PHV36_09415 [Elusimicrobiales bacterium]|nr:hypothetical protein [Elusimicrobiales bacterium]